MIYVLYLPVYLVDAVFFFLRDRSGALVTGHPDEAETSPTGRQPEREDRPETRAHGADREKHPARGLHPETSHYRWEHCCFGCTVYFQKWNNLCTDTVCNHGCLSVGQVNYPKVLDEDSSDALSPEQPASQESQSSVPSPGDNRAPETPSLVTTAPQLPSTIFQVRELMILLPLLLLLPSPSSSSSPLCATWHRCLVGSPLGRPSDYSTAYWLHNSDLHQWADWYSSSRDSVCTATHYYPTLQTRPHTDQSKKTQNQPCFLSK